MLSIRLVSILPFRCEGLLLANRSWEDTPNVLWTFVATNFGLTIAAISQAEQKQLTLYEGIEVSNLVWLANFSTMLSLASYARQRKHSHREGTKTKHDDMVKYFAVLQTLFSVPLTIYLWATAKTFGSNTDCNSQVIYVFFFANLEAVTKGRIVGLVLTSILTVFYLPMTVSELWRSCGRQHRHRNKSDTARHRRRKPRRDVTLAVPDIEHKKNSIDGILGASLRSVKRIRLSKLDSTLVGIFIFQALLFTYFITCNELYVHRNHTDKSDAQWGFGQILSLVITLPSVVAVVRAFKKHGLKKVRRPESEDLEHGSHDTPDSSDLGSLNYHRREHSGSTLSHRQFASGADGDGAEAEQLLAVPPLIVPRSPRS